MIYEELLAIEDSLQEGSVEIIDGLWIDKEDTHLWEVNDKK